jgi:hypothetical protein
VLIGIEILQHGRIFQRRMVKPFELSEAFRCHRKRSTLVSLS